MRYPACISASLFASGILLGYFITVPLFQLFALAFAFVAFCLFLPRLRHGFLYPLILVTGWVGIAQYTAILDPADIRNVTPSMPTLITLHGTLASSPSDRVIFKQGQRQMRSMALVEVEECIIGNRTLPCHGTIVAFCPELLPPTLFESSRVAVSGLLSVPKGPLAPGLFNYKKYLEQKRIFRTLNTDAPSDWKLAEGSPSSPPLTERFQRWSKITLANGLPEQDETLELIWALFLDWKAGLAGEMADPFFRSGTYHIFAVDGLRIGLISLILLRLLKAFGLNKATAGFIVIPVIWFYAGMTGFPASAIRAGLMMTLVIGTWCIARPAQVLNSLFLAAFIILAWEPSQLFQTGFQLSFLVVAVLICWIPLLQKAEHKIFAADPFLPPSLYPKWRKMARAPGKLFSEWTLTSVAAWLGSLALSAYYFHLFSMISIPANIVVVPLTALALMSCVGSLLTAFLAPWASVLFNHATWGLMHAILAVSRWCSELPGAAWNWPAPSAMVVVISFCVIFYIPVRRLFRKSTLLVLDISAAAATLVMAWMMIQEFRYPKLTLISASGSDTIFARHGFSATLFNPGNQSPANSVIGPFLLAQGVNELDAVVVTQSDAGHAGGLHRILRKLKTRSLFDSGMKSKSAVVKKVEAALKESERETLPLVKGSVLNGWRILHPSSEEKYTRAEDAGLIAMGTWNGFSTLCLFGAGAEGQKSLIANNENLPVDVLISGVNSRRQTITPELLKLCNPRLIVIMDSDFPPQKSLPYRAREELRKTNARVLFMSETGSLTLRPGAKGLVILNAEGNEIATVKK